LCSCGSVRSIQFVFERFQVFLNQLECFVSYFFPFLSTVDRVQLIKRLSGCLCCFGSIFDNAFLSVVVRTFKSVK